MRSSSSDSEAEPSGWQTWYNTHAAPLLLYARQWLPCRADAEDAVQAGFVKFWRRQRQPQATHLPLLYTAVRCAALDLLKIRARRSQREATAQISHDDAWWDADTLAERERAAQMQEALQSLPHEQREVLILRIWGELPFQEIAATLGAPLPTVTSRYRYALANLKKLFPEDCHEPSFGL